MLDAFTILVGTILGFLSGLGIGGGSLLILWLTMVMGIEPEIARGMNLIFFIPTALISCIIRYRQGTVSLRRLVPAMAAGCITAGVFSLLSMRLHDALLRKLFGIILLITGVRELLYRPRKAR